MDKELASLSLRQMDLSGTTMKMCKPHGFKTVGDLLSKTPAALLSFGFTGASILEIARASAELQLGWASEDDVRKVFPEAAEPLRPSLPRWLLKHERVTYVLTGDATPRTLQRNLACPRCKKPLMEVVHVDLSAFPDAGLPPRSLRVGRCNSSECQNPHDATPHGWVVELGAPGQGTRPASRKEFDYPDLFDAARLGKSSDRVDALLLDQKSDVIGSQPRIGGWPGWSQYASRGWP
jgi:hypothetical protein